jgi:hypothetical protein
VVKRRLDHLVLHTPSETTLNAANLVIDACAAPTLANHVLANRLQGPRSEFCCAGWSVEISKRFQRGADSINFARGGTVWLHVISDDVLPICRDEFRDSYGVRIVLKLMTISDPLGDHPVVFLDGR